MVLILGPTNMQALKMVLADIDRVSREHTRLMLTEFGTIDVVADCDTVRDTMEAVRSLRPELVLSDVRLKDGCAFEVIDHLPSGCRPAMILTSVNAQHALKAFECHVADYLLKPVNRHRLLDSISSLNLRFPRCEKAVSLVAHSVGVLQNNEPYVIPRFCVRTAGRFILVNLDDIDWIQAAANYVRLHIGEISYNVRESIGDIAERLDASRFIRIHRSIIVNLYRISEVRPCNSGEFMVTLSTGKELSCSRSFRMPIARLISNRPT
jgi:two-component system, LytTR family, response regulator